MEGRNTGQVGDRGQAALGVRTEYARMRGQIMVCINYSSRVEDRGAHAAQSIDMQWLHDLS